MTKQLFSPGNLPVVGAICGDILGSVYEFTSTKDLDHKLCIYNDQFTDDTVSSPSQPNAYPTDLHLNSISN